MGFDGNSPITGYDIECKNKSGKSLTSASCVSASRTFVSSSVSIHLTLKDTPLPLSEAGRVLSSGVTSLHTVCPGVLLRQAQACPALRGLQGLRLAPHCLPGTPVPQGRGAARPRL